MHRDNTINLLLKTIEGLRLQNKEAVQTSKSLLIQVQGLTSELTALQTKEDVRVLEFEKDLENMALEFKEASQKSFIVNNINRDNKVS
jgi:hypothetical protein